ncbi:hypothetical protein G6F46_006876 [Rhizopus delemar]|uniref:KH type-2 domain-containing protein n=2 Tax=Rhizopus TaxID=4842 RepID=A0A9P6Z2T0_9FUNG|nr:hypothetical protein G6F55_005472 [Rhizopus delemar]KAG1542856.1 hypothetical protein G6F51_007025 [Rhizopus arrhizus]KAG1496796.1 hypothetical protein G6F54_006222 [Rhizopus delemar]KAG1510489.1 hypothetical protein G6F53_006647 [Rhizopus delemar]KAG1522824.1 hypothetical protein G6F52_005530 [Rhizopus delemar]
MLPSKEAFFFIKQSHRCYAIMSRAKHRAGIPIVNTPPAKNTTKNKKNSQKLDNDKSNKASTAISSSKFQTSQTAVPNSMTRKQYVLKTQPTEPVIKKPAGISERLIQVPKDVIQPMDPHLLKVAVIGAANAGKSTLINKLVGEEVSGVSSKAHTTRERILAVLSEGNHQIVFLDTPGIIPENNHAQMNRILATSSWRSLDEADHAMIMVDANWCLSEKSRKTEEFLLSRLHDSHIPATLIFNKMDLINNDTELLENVKERYKQGYRGIRQIAYTSATQETNLDIKMLFNNALSKPWIYPAEQKIEMPNLKRVEEIIRVEFFKKLHYYIPYMLKQENVGWTEVSDKMLIIDQNVYVERESQLKIVIGTNGSIINNVVKNAREKISRAFGKPVRLNLQVKTRKSTANVLL